MASSSPLDRDRFMDLLRVFGVFLVVAGHWLAVIPHIRGGQVSGDLIYNVRPDFWAVTWAFEVLPLFFFVGGFANHVSYTAPRGERSGRSYTARRLRRLLTPALAFLALWAVVEVALHVLDLGGTGPVRGMVLGHITPFESLWFLGVYLVVVLLCPLTIRLHRRWRAAVPAALCLLIAAFDALAAASGNRAWLLANILWVWLLPHQLGYFYADGTLQAVPARVFAIVAAAALAATAALTGIPFYGRNLLDSGTQVLGVTAPTTPFALMCVWVVASALALRRPLARLLARERLWRLVRRLNRGVMTVYLWHMTAFFAVVAALAHLGAALPDGPDATWWAERPLYLVAPVPVLAILVALFGRFEAATAPTSSQVRGGLAETGLR